MLKTQLSDPHTLCCLIEELQILPLVRESERPDIFMYELYSFIFAQDVTCWENNPGGHVTQRFLFCFVTFMASADTLIAMG